MAEYLALPEPTDLPEIRARVNNNFQYLIEQLASEGVGNWEGLRSDTEPTNKWVGRIWIDTSGEVEVTKVWTGTEWFNLSNKNGDMLKSVYDTDGDGRVNSAPEYDAVHQELVFKF